MGRGGVAQVTQFDAHGLADAQAGVVDEGERGAVTRLARGAEQRGDLRAVEHQRQGLGRGDADLLEDGPAGGEAVAVAEEAAEGAAGELHGGAAVALLLAEIQEVRAKLVLGQGGGVGALVFGQLAHVADVFVLGGLAVIPVAWRSFTRFELDKVGELCDGGERLSNHGAANVPASAGSRAPPDAKTIACPQR